jgi:hypothetical protein
MRGPDVEAEFTLRSSDAGGRETPAISGYRPQHRLLPGHLSSGTHEYANGNSVQPGGTTTGTITFITPEAYPRCLDEHDILEISEGSRVVGRARILAVSNPVLQRPPGTHLAVPDYAEWSDDSNPLPENWLTVDPKSGQNLVAELNRELAPGHVLRGQRLRAVGRSRPQDDVLFESLDDRTAFVVHLTWSAASDPRWPHTIAFDNIGHFFRRWPREELDD